MHGDLVEQRASCHDLGLYDGTQAENSRSVAGQTQKCGVEVKITRDGAPRAKGLRVPLPGRWSDFAADDAVGAVAVPAARGFDDMILMFVGRVRGVGRNG